MLYILGTKYEQMGNQHLRYVVPPQTREYKGTYSLTPQNGHSFTLETKTGSLGKGKGTCDTVYSLSMKKGFSFHAEQLF